MPVLVVGHAADACVRTPASLMGKITARTNGAREQVVTVTGGPGGAGAGLEACQGARRTASWARRPRLPPVSHDSSRGEATSGLGRLNRPNQPLDFPRRLPFLPPTFVIQERTGTHARLLRS